ncbi:MAG TPA: single-stranded-DNA-specific exonuclease RecJ, partial [Candidatus Gracilibacteria bacterium]
LESLKKALIESFEVPLSAIDQVFLDPEIQHLHDPFLMSGMDKAVAKIREYLPQISNIKDQKSKRIMIYGDFDTDGVTSTIILVQALTQLGAVVSYRIPDRTSHSHGLKKEIIDEIVEKQVGLLITCDCGINDHEEVAYAVSKGLEVIVTDHHDPDPKRFPREALAVVNPLLDHCAYPDQNLSGAGIALKLVQALLDPCELEPYLEMAAMGIIADCVPLRGESRIIAKLGLEALKDTGWEGLRSFFIEQEIDPDAINEETVAFHLAPRINAASRLGDVMMATQLFLGEPSKIDARWGYLHNLNEKRKVLTDQTLQEALEQVDETAACQIVFAPHWRQGILGLVASRISEKYTQPVLAVRQVDEYLVSGSCRAPEGFSMIEALRANEDLLLQYGGHAGAAGFTCKLSNLRTLEQRLKDYFAAQNIEKAALSLAALVNIEVLNMELVDFLNRLAPFGMGHQKPILGIEGLQILSVQPMGQSGDHFRLTGSKDDQVVELVGFFKGDWITQITPGEIHDVAFTVGDNYFQGERKIQLKLEDIRVMG